MTARLRAELEPGDRLSAVECWTGLAATQAAQEAPDADFDAEEDDERD